MADGGDGNGQAGQIQQLQQGQGNSPMRKEVWARAHRFIRRSFLA